MSLFPFLHHAKVATDGYKDDRKKSSCMPSRPVRDNAHHVVPPRLPPIHRCIHGSHAQWNFTDIIINAN